MPAEQTVGKDGGVSVLPGLDIDARERCGIAGPRLSQTQREVTHDKSVTQEKVRLQGLNLCHALTALRLFSWKAVERPSHAPVTQNRRMPIWRQSGARAALDRTQRVQGKCVSCARLCGHLSWHPPGRPRRSNRTARAADPGAMVHRHLAVAVARRAAQRRSGGRALSDRQARHRRVRRQRNPAFRAGRAIEQIRVLHLGQLRLHRQFLDPGDTGGGACLPWRG